MSPLKTLCAAAALACALLPASALAAGKVLFLSTDELTSPGVNGVEIMNGAYEAFEQAAGGAANIIDKRQYLTNGTLAASDFTGVDVVVVQSVYKPITAANMAFLANLMQTRPDLTFLMFIDGCCSTAANITPATAALSAMTGWTLGRSSSGGNISSPLNASSPYQAGFAGVPQLMGNAYDLITNVPGGYALFLNQGATPPATLATPTNAYGLVLPQKRASAGQGACTVFVADTSIFHNPPYSPQRGPLAAAALAAARNASGACAGNTIEPDLTPELSGPNALQPGVPQTYSVTARNIGLSGSTDGKVTVQLPTGMDIVPGSFPTSCTWTAPNLECTLPAIAAGGSAPAISFAATPSVTGPLTLQSRVTNVTGEANLANNAASASRTGAPRGNLTVGLPVQSVPAMGGWGLGLLAAALGFMGARRQRKAA